MTVPTHHALYSLAATLQGIEETLVADVLGFADRQNDPEMGTALEKRIHQHGQICEAATIPMTPYMQDVYRMVKAARSEGIPISWEDIWELLPAPSAGSTNGREFETPSDVDITLGRIADNEPTGSEWEKTRDDEDQPSWSTIEEETGAISSKKEGRGSRDKGCRRPELDELDGSGDDGRDEGNRGQSWEEGGDYNDDPIEESARDSDGVLDEQCEYCIKAGRTKHRTPVPCTKDGGFKVCDRCHRLKFPCSLKPELTKYRLRQKDRAGRFPPRSRLHPHPSGNGSRYRTRSASKSRHQGQANSQGYPSARSQSMREATRSTLRFQRDDGSDEISEDEIDEETYREIQCRITALQDQVIRIPKLLETIEVQEDVQRSRAKQIHLKSVAFEKGSKLIERLTRRTDRLRKEYDDEFQRLEGLKEFSMDSDLAFERDAPATTQASIPPDHSDGSLIQQ